MFGANTASESPSRPRENYGPPCTRWMVNSLAKRRGNKRRVVEREIVNGLMHILSTGCQWASLPKDLTLRSSANHDFCHWDSDGTLGRIQHALYVGCRELAEREPHPNVTIILS
jgi:transposase